MKRILIFSLTYHPYVGGAEVAIKEITDRLGEGYEFDMVTLRFDRSLPKVERIGNITVYRIGPSVRNTKVSDRNMPLTLRFAKVIFPFTSLVRAYQLHRIQGYDAIWAMMANHAGFGALFFKYVHPGVPYVLELQDGRAFADMKIRRPLLRAIWWLYKRVYMKADIIKTVSRFIEREVRSIGFQGTIAVIPNAVDAKKFSAPVTEERIIELKEKYGKRMGDVFLFTASRLVLSRGVEDVIRSLAHLPAHVKLLVAGEGDDRSALEDIVRTEGLQDRVLFAGHIDHSELPAYYKVSDIFVRPSIIEGFGVSFIEAFAAGIPVVATSVGGIPDFLFDPETDPDTEPTGLFCEVRNPGSVARAVRKYMENPALTARIIKNARELAVSTYDWTRITQDVHARVFAPLISR